MASYPNGVLGSITGVLGPYKFRRRQDGTIQFFPRYPRDKRSPAQLEARRKFSQVAHLSSHCYQITLKPYWIRPNPHYNAFARSIQRSLPGLYYYKTIPRFYIGGEWELPAPVPSIVLTGTPYITRAEFRLSVNKWLLPGDKIYCAIHENDGEFRISQEPIVYPANKFVLGRGFVFPGYTPVTISCLVTRDVAGLYDLVSAPYWSNWNMLYSERLPIVAG